MLPKFLFKACRCFTTTDRQADGLIRRPRSIARARSSAIGKLYPIMANSSAFAMARSARHHRPSQNPFPLFPISRREMKCFRERGHYHCGQTGSTVETGTARVNEVTDIRGIRDRAGKIEQAGYLMNFHLRRKTRSCRRTRGHASSCFHAASAPRRATAVPQLSIEKPYPVLMSHSPAARNARSTPKS